MHLISSWKLPPSFQFVESTLKLFLTNSLVQRAVPGLITLPELWIVCDATEHQAQIVERRESRADDCDVGVAQLLQRSPHLKVLLWVFACQNAQLHDRNVGGRMNEEEWNEDAMVPASLIIHLRLHAD